MKVISKENRFIRFAIVGFSGTIVDFAIFNLFNSIVGITPIPSSMISFSVSVFNNYYWNRNWTFPESKQFPFSTQIIKFSIVSIIGLIIRTSLFSILEKPIIILITEQSKITLFANPAVIGHNISLGIVIVIVLFWNYLANKLWTYKGI